MSRIQKAPMGFKHIEDIDYNKRVDAKELDKRMGEVVHRMSNKLEALQGVKGVLLFLLRTQLRLFLSTHRSIRLLIGRKEEEPECISDAVSLAREQIEKVFVIALVLDDPERWLPIYFKSGWKTYYERYLLRVQELEALDRWEDYVTVEAPKDLDILRYLPPEPPNGPVLIVSDLEKEAVEFKFQNPNVELPPRLKPIYKKEEFEFPTPGRARDRVRNPRTKLFLERWCKEYQNSCGYSHALQNKLGLSVLFEKSDLRFSSYTNTIERKLSEETVYLSWIATVSAATEVLKLVRHDLDVLAALTEFWARLRDSVLFAEPFWQLHAQHLMPKVIS
jgi:hypothetical protein